MRAGLERVSTWGPLHQVWFVLDYFTLVFADGQRIDIFNPAEVRKPEAIAFGAPSFADTLVGCINSNITNLNYAKGEKLVVSLSNGVDLEVKLDSNPHSIPEAFEISGDEKLGLWTEFN